MMREEEKTPIEIALGEDEEGMTTAKKLYAFLELHSNNYSRWVKKNILENIFAEEGLDYLPLAKKGERSISAFQTNQQNADYKLTASFAKKLAMASQTRRGQEVLEYYVQVEQYVKDLTTVIIN